VLRFLCPYTRPDSFLSSATIAHEAPHKTVNSPNEPPADPSPVSPSALCSLAQVRTRDIVSGSMRRTRTHPSLPLLGNPSHTRNPRKSELVDIDEPPADPPRCPVWRRSKRLACPDFHFTAPFKTKRSSCSSSRSSTHRAPGPWLHSHAPNKPVRTTIVVASSFFNVLSHKISSKSHNLAIMVTWPSAPARGATVL